MRQNALLAAHLLAATACGTDHPPCLAADAAAAAAIDGGVVAVPLVACVPSVYAARVRVGAAQDFELLLDTGSTTLAVAATGCTSCAAAGVVELYQPGAAAVDRQTPVSATYGALAPSGWSGEIFEDSVGVSAVLGPVNVDLVAITDQQQLLVGTCACGAPPQGILGLAPGRTATPGTTGLLDRLVAAGSIADRFATRLCPSEGTLWLGGYDEAFTTAPPVYTPMAPPGFAAYVYTVILSSIDVLDASIPVPSGEYTAALLDTGSSISSLQPVAFAALSARIAASPAFVEIFGAAAASFFSSPNNCVALLKTREELDALLPVLTLRFGTAADAAVTAAATESYLLADGNGRWCPSMVARQPSPALQQIAAILGAPLLASNVVIFDRAHRRVGFAPHAACRELPAR